MTLTRIQMTVICEFITVTLTFNYLIAWLANAFIPHGWPKELITHPSFINSYKKPRVEICVKSNWYSDLPL